MELEFKKKGPSSNKAIRKKIALSMMNVKFLRKASKELSKKDMEDLINAHAIMFSTLAGGMSAGGYSSLKKMLNGIEKESKEILREMKNETV